MNKPNSERHLNRKAIAHNIREAFKQQYSGKMTPAAKKLEKEVKIYLYKFVEPQLVEGYSLYLNDTAAAEALKLTARRCKVIKEWLQEAGFIILARKQTINFNTGEGRTSYWIFNRTYLLERRVQKQAAESLHEDSETMADAVAPMGTPKKRTEHYGAAHRKVRVWSTELASLSMGGGWFEERFFWARSAEFMTLMLDTCGLTRADFRIDAPAERQAAVEEAFSKLEAVYEQLAAEMEADC